MKQYHLIGILMIVVAIVIFLSAAEDVSTYANFSDAVIENDVVKISGTLAKDKKMTYDPQNDPNNFIFFLTDAEGTTEKVILTQPKPQDFELAEQIVVTGKRKGGTFVANSVLTKCPSKYKDEELYLQSES